MVQDLSDIARYYSDKLQAHGCSPGGVDWNGEAGQTLRFEQLAKLLPRSDFFSVNDLGCGYGAFIDFLNGRSCRFSYLGYDISPAMLEAAARRYANSEQVHFRQGGLPEARADYSIASGIFNVRLDHDEREWESYLSHTLDSMDRHSERGFAFNCLSTYADDDRKRHDLYYGDPCHWFRHCKERYSRHVSLLHDYGLYEFTILVRKDPP